MVKTPDQLQELFLQYLHKQQFDRHPHSLYAPVAYIMSLGGKRLRPLLSLMGCQLFGRTAQDALPAAMAVEVFHNFSLVHDDIMDQAPLRRGQPTVHHRFGLNAGILSGDAMLIEAYNFLCQRPSDVPLDRLMRIFNRMAIEVCEGQAADMDFETRSDVTLPEYLRMIEQKTAVLIGAALSLGAVIAGASDEEEVHIDAFGRNIGIAFQIQDDLLDTFGDPEKFGKKTGGDIVQNKKTFLFLKAWEVAGAEMRERLMYFYEHNDLPEHDKIEGVMEIFRKLDVPAFAESAKTEFQQKAMAHLASIDASAAHKAPIEAFAEMLFSRNT